MNKIRLINIGGTDLYTPYLMEIFEKWFVMELYDSTNTYDKNNCVFVITRGDHWDNIIEKYLDNGYKLILANAWEAHPYPWTNTINFEKYLNNILLVVGSKQPTLNRWKNILSVPNWFWYNEYFLHMVPHSKPLYFEYYPNRTNSKLFLMPMRRQKSFRTIIRNKFFFEVSSINILRLQKIVHMLRPLL